jgi:hypothetical protein
MMLWQGILDSLKNCRFYALPVLFASGFSTSLLVEAQAYQQPDSCELPQSLPLRLARLR